MKIKWPRSRIWHLLVFLAMVLSPSLSMAPPVKAQGPNQFLIPLKTRQFTPAPGLEIAAVRTLRAGPPGALVHFLLQFERIPDAGERGRLAEQGINLLTYVGGNTYITSAIDSALDPIRSLPNVRWLGPLEPNDKIDPELQAGNIGRWARVGQGKVQLDIQFHQDVALVEAEALIAGLGGEFVASVDILPLVTAVFHPGQVQQIARQDAVQYITAVEPPLSPANDGARAAANVDPLLAAPYNLDGTGVTVLVYDVGQADPGHADFGARIIQNDGSNIADHATHVAGTVAGSGANSNGNDSAGNANGGTANQWSGMAPNANLRSFGTTGNAVAFYNGNGGDLNADFTTAINAGIDLATMSLANNVYQQDPDGAGPQGPPCNLLGDYTSTAILIDNIVTASINNQALIYVEAAGNERGTSNGGAVAPCGQFGTIASPATAKNSIAVGAINSNNNTIAGFSSLGPTDDGRLKPDLTAPGCQTTGDGGITSPSFIDQDPDGAGPMQPNGILDAGEVQNVYVVKCGTSMATPVVSGSAALLIEQWRSTRGAAARPLPHTVKAIFVHTATDRGNPGPDFQFGWGTLDAQAAVDLVIADDTADLIHVDQVDNGDTDFYTLNSDGSANVQVTLAWDDRPAAQLAAATLINDLDLRLTDPDGIVYQPFVLDAANPANNATTGNDALNNVEMVVGNAKAGTWTVSVAGTTVPMGPQAYTLITPEDAAAGNRPPVADANGPYTTDEGIDVTLDGTNSADPDGDTLAYAWDLDNDGLFDDATGPTPTFTMVGQDGVFTVHLRVTDPDGAFDTDATTVTVDNVPPTIVSLSSDAPKDEGATVTISGTATDPGWLEILTATIDWGDGSAVEAVGGTLENVRPDATLTFDASHVYGDNGDFEAQVCVADDDVATCETIQLQIDNVDPTAVIDESNTILVNGVPTFLAQAGDTLDFSGRSTDPGSDDLTLSWDWDDGPPSPDVSTTYLVNPPNPDPFPSPSIQPRDITDLQTHAFADACLYVIGFMADDDDDGHGEDTANVIIVGNADYTRSAGYWLHQYRGRGNADFSQATLECYLEIVGYMSQVFNEERDASTIPAAHQVLFANNNQGSVADLLDQQLLAVWLNFANGALELDELIDTNGDRLLDTSFIDVVTAAETVRLNPNATSAEIEAQKDILERINVRDERWVRAAPDAPGASPTTRTTYIPIIVR